MDLHAFEYLGTVVSIVDGDTVRATLETGFGHHFGTEHKPIRVRLKDTYAPELKDQGGPEARDWMTARLLGKRIYGISHTGSPDKYGRYLLTLYEPPGADKSVNQEIVEAGHAKVMP